MFYSIDVLSDQLPYLDVGFVLLFKQYNYILNEDKVKICNFIHSTILRIIISVVKIAAQRTFERNYIRSVDKTIEGRVKDFGNVFKKSKSAFHCLRR